MGSAQSKIDCLINDPALFFYDYRDCISYQVRGLVRHVSSHVIIIDVSANFEKDMTPMLKTFNNAERGYGSLASVKILNLILDFLSLVMDC